jgi:hypothetical protein
MPTIGNNLLPYPNTSDEPNVPKAISDLASAVDVSIGGGGRLFQTLADLQSVPTTQLFEGLRAYVIADNTLTNNGGYWYRHGAWHPTGHIEQEFAIPADGRKWNVVTHATIVDQTVFGDLWLKRTTDNWTNAPWDSSPIWNIPTWLQPANGTDLHFPMAGNYPGSTAIQITPGTIALRIIAASTWTQNLTWASGGFSWRIGE